MSKDFDIVIVGGGIVGLTLACALARQTSLSIAIFEAQSTPISWSSTSYHHRVSAITLSSRRIFQSLNVWDEIKNKRVSPFSKIEVCDGITNSEIKFNSYEIEEPVLGFIIENNLVQLVLEEQLKHYPQIIFFTGMNLENFYRENDYLLLNTNNTLFRTKLLIGADGQCSWVRDQAEIPLKKQDYHQQAIVANVQTSLSHQQIARQVFLSTGPLAFLPLMDEFYSSIVWTLPTEEAQQLMALDDQSFQQSLTRAFSFRLGDVRSIASRYSFPLQNQQADHYIAPRVVLVGDAAHVIHPLAGQGVNMGLLDAASLAEVIINAINDRQDFSQQKFLRRYERWRKADNLALLIGVNVIKNLFSIDKTSINMLRQSGLTVLNHFPSIKNIFTRYAVGDRELLPSMAKS